MPFDLLWKFVDVCYIHILKDPVPFCSVNRTFLFQKFELTKFESFRFLEKRWYRTQAFEILSSETKSQKWRVGGNLTSCWVFDELEIKFFFFESSNNNYNNNCDIRQQRKEAVGTILTKICQFFKENRQKEKKEKRWQKHSVKSSLALTQSIIKVTTSFYDEYFIEVSKTKYFSNGMPLRLRH